jgi:hypothetical protein
MIPVNKHERTLNAKNCFDAVVSEGRFTITLIPYDELPVPPPLIASMKRRHQFGANDERHPPKRRKNTNGETDL